MCPRPRFSSAAPCLPVLAVAVLGVLPEAPFSSQRQRLIKTPGEQTLSLNFSQFVGEGTGSV
jgi:hypothetical protein